MKLQIIQDNLGKPTGVYVPMEDWTIIKNNYPDIETVDQDLPQWEKDIIDERLQAIAQDPKKLRPIEELLVELNKDI